MNGNSSFTLRIRIMGLAMFVYDKSAMYVLMPATGADCKHNATIYFDKKHNEDSQSVRVSVPFDGCLWDLSNLTSDPVDTELPVPPIIALHRHARKRYPRSQLDALGVPSVHSRLKFGSGGWRQHGQTAKFELHDEEVTLTNWIEWEISGIPGDRLAWTFQGLNGHPDQTPPPLQAVDGVIALEVVHAPLGEHADRYETGTCATPTPAHHFHAYYDVLGAPHRNAPVCVPNSLKPGRRRFPILKGGRDFVARRDGGKVYTCMLAQSTVDPNS